jgi:hypothetical protein
MVMIFLDPRTCIDHHAEDLNAELGLRTNALAHAPTHKRERVRKITARGADERKTHGPAEAEAEIRRIRAHATRLGWQGSGEEEIQRSERPAVQQHSGRREGIRIPGRATRVRIDAAWRA